MRQFSAWMMIACYLGFSTTGCEESPLELVGLKTVESVEECCVDGVIDDCCAHLELNGGETTDAPAPQGGIPIPPGVRENLGVTFATVERREVAESRRAPGQFELLPTARQEFRGVLSGRVKLAVAQFDAVEAGQVLFSIDSPRWRQIQHEAVEAEGEIVITQAALEVARARRQEVRAALGVQDKRLANLASVNVRKADLESEAAVLRSSLPRLDAEIRAQEAALREATEHYDSRLKTLASVTGLPVETLRGEDGEEAAWRSISTLAVRAERAGIVETIAVNDGGWLEEGELSMTVLDPERIRFHAEAPQSDLAHYRNGQTARIVPPQGGSVDLQSAMTGPLTLGLTANQDDRTISLYVTPDTLTPWAKAGVAGYLEVGLYDDDAKTLAIPTSAIVQDGLDKIFFRRDPKDPNRALRVVADLGPTDGRWTVLRSGVMEGDEVVLDGAYAIKLTGSETMQAPPGYHYHADGSLHKDH